MGYYLKRLITNLLEMNKNVYLYTTLTNLIVIDIGVVKLVGVGADIFPTWLNPVLSANHLFFRKKISSWHVCSFQEEKMQPFFSQLVLNRTKDNNFKEKADQRNFRQRSRRRKT